MAHRQSADPEPPLGEEPTEPLPPLTDDEVGAIKAWRRELHAYWDRVYEGLRRDAQSCARSMQHSPLFAEAGDWDSIVDRSLDDYRSGRSLMDRLGADRLLDPALTGMLLAIRRGRIEEIASPWMGDYVLIDMAVIAFANAMRVQSMVGNTALVVEGEMFGQPTLRARWKKQFGGRPEDINGLVVEEYVARLRDGLLPLAKQFHQMASDAADGLRRQRQMPSSEVERALPLVVRLAPAQQEERQAIEQTTDASNPPGGRPDPKVPSQDPPRSGSRSSAGVPRPVHRTPLASPRKPRDSPLGCRCGGLRGWSSLDPSVGS
jgi:hypothetical protein